MSRLNFQHRAEGHRVEPPSNRDLEQKLTYQQLLNLNHDLSKENQSLKNIGSLYLTQPVDSGKNWGIYTLSSTFGLEIRTTNSTTPSDRTPSCTSINSLSSLFLMPMKQKSKNLKMDSKRSTNSSSTLRKNTLRFPLRTNVSERTSLIKSKNLFRCISQAVHKN